MTQKQVRFCEHYASSLNATKAAIFAGYSEKSATNQGSRLIRNDEIQKYIHELQEKNIQECDEIPDCNKILRFWASEMNNPKLSPTIRHNASVCLAKYRGLFREDADW